MKEGEGEHNFYSSKSGTFLVFCFCFIIGVGFFTVWTEVSFLLSYFFITFFILLLCLIIWWQSVKIRFYVFIFLALTLAGYRVSVFNFDYSQNNESDIWHRKLNLTGTVTEEPELGQDKNRMVLSNLFINGVPLSGKVLLNTKVFQVIFYGDIFSFSCHLVRPENFTDNTFNYKKYLMSKKIFALCYYPQKLKKIGEKHNFKFYIFSIKDAVARRIRQMIPEPSASLLTGILYGARSGLPDKLVEAFRRTGLSHIVAVSGYNVQVISLAIFSFGSVIGIGRKKLFYWSVLFILFFTFFTGASASVVRAAVMGLSVLVAHYFGRPSGAARILFFAAALMLFFNPYYLWYDVGFALSFLAATGLIFLLPLFKHLFAGITLKMQNLFLNGIWEIFLTTLSACVATSPLLLYQFNQLSIVALPANLLVLWLIPWVMLLGFLSTILSFFILPVAYIPAGITTIFLSYIIFIAEKGGALPLSVVTWQPPLVVLFLIYAIMVLWIIRYYKKYEKDFLANVV